MLNRMYPDKTAGYVYLITIGDGFCKIGRSRNLPERCRIIDSASPFPTELLGAISAHNARSTERRWHENFQHKCVRKEWYMLDAEDIEQFLDCAAWSGPDFEPFYTEEDTDWQNA